MAFHLELFRFFYPEKVGVSLRKETYPVSYEDTLIDWWWYLAFKSSSYEKLRKTATFV
jgi:hypothetical protein